MALYDMLFLVSQSFIPAVNAALLGFLLFKSRLVPRVLPLLGFFGAALLVAKFGANLADLSGGFSSAWGFTAIPIALWEFSLGVYLIVKGFRPSPITAGMNATRTSD